LSIFTKDSLLGLEKPSGVLVDDEIYAWSILYMDKVHGNKCDWILENLPCWHKTCFRTKQSNFSEIFQ